MTTITIRNTEAADESEWRQMWDGYCAFYKTTVATDVTDFVWLNIMDATSAIKSTVAIDENSRILGFANYVAHPYTWGTDLVCYLEDLYVKPAARGLGFGRALIDDLIERARTNGWQRVYWLTAADNREARRLYDHYGEADGFLRYVVKV